MKNNSGKEIYGKKKYYQNSDFVVCEFIAFKTRIKCKNNTQNYKYCDEHIKFFNDRKQRKDDDYVEKHIKYAFIDEE